MCRRRHRLGTLLSEIRTEQAGAAQHTSTSSKPTSKSAPQHTEETDVPPSSPECPGTSANIETTKEPILDPTTNDTSAIPSPPPSQQMPPQTDGKPERSHLAKRLKKRPRVPSEVFASEPSSPGRDPAIVSAGGPSSQPQPDLAAPSTATDGTPISTPIKLRVPPRVVDSVHGRVLVDQNGHVPRAYPLDGKESEEVAVLQQQEVEDKVQWPPLRGRTAKQRKVSGPEDRVDAHHPFSQVQPRPRPRPPEVLPRSAASGEGEPEKRHQALEHAPLPDRRAVVSQFLGKVGDTRNNVAPQVQSEHREDVVPNGTSPVKRVTLPAPDPFSGPPKLSSKVLKFPAPRASTRSPFRPESPAGENRHPPPQPQPPPSRTRAARHPALSRVRRQTIDNRRNDRRERERRPEDQQVPSIDLVALSRSSTSARTDSHSSTDGSIPARPARWSLPTFAHTTEWRLGPGSGSPFRWTSPAYGNMLGREGGRTLMPRFMFTPSPARSVTAVATDGTSASAPLSVLSAVPSPSMVPHPSDLSLTASHGLATILAHMSANHALGIGVVEAVYHRVGSLSEADEVLKGMREAAEGFGEREIERRMRERAREREREGGRGGSASGTGRSGRAREAALRYVLASEDGEGSEYSPPETSRAALWKRQSEPANHADEGGEEEEEEEEGRAVEEELRDVGDENDDEGPPAIQHDFSQRVPTLEEAHSMVDEDENRNNGAHHMNRSREDGRTVADALVEHIPAQELERKMGRGQFRRDIVKRFR